MFLLPPTLATRKSGRKERKKTRFAEVKIFSKVSQCFFGNTFVFLSRSGLRDRETPVTRREEEKLQMHSLITSSQTSFIRSASTPLRLVIFHGRYY